MADDHGFRVDSWTPAPKVGDSFDCGWAIGILHADDTVSRTCKGCGVTVRSAVVEGANGVGEVVPVPVHHRDGCAVVVALALAAALGHSA